MVSIHVKQLEILEERAVCEEIGFKSFWLGASRNFSTCHDFCLFRSLVGFGQITNAKHQVGPWNFAHQPLLVFEEFATSDTLDVY